MLRALRETVGVSQAGWVALLQLAAQEQKLAIAASEDTLQRWEAGRSVPDAAAGAAIVAVCRERGLLRAYTGGVLAGETITAESLQALLAEARLHGGRRVPVLQALPSRPPSNLPAAISSFVGREREMAAAEPALAEARLLTLTGPGGVGKTRLALELAQALRDRFPEGVWLVELAPLSGGELVMQAVAAILDVREAPGRTLQDALADYLARRSLLLVLDNCEHLIDACARLSLTLLSAGPGVRLLATSRERLGVPGEVVWPVPPLSLESSGFQVPRSTVQPAQAWLTERIGVHGTWNLESNLPDAVRLFGERARAARPGWSLTAANARAVLQVCRRLDGIPLAIELAAARLNVLTVEQLSGRLEDSLGLLASGGRGVPERHLTLRATLDWSHNLLSTPERVLLRRSAVFAGGFTLEAAEVVCGGDGLDPARVLDLVSQLADRSWLVVEADGEEARYRLLEPVRQYAREQLDEAAAADERSLGEAVALQERHLGWCLAFAEAAERAFHGTHQQEWLARVGREVENMRVALAWCATDGGAEAGLRLAAALAPFWEIRGHYAEGREWLEGALVQRGPVKPRTRIRALLAAALLAQRRTEYPAATAHYEEALALARESDEERLVGRALRGLGMMAHLRGDYDAARALLADAMAIAQSTADRADTASVLYQLGLVGRAQADYPSARARLEEALSVWRKLGDRRLAASALNMLGVVAEAQADYDRAWTLFEESLTLKREVDDRQGVAVALANLSMVAQVRRDIVTARSLMEEALTIALDLGDRRTQASAIDDLGRMATAEGDYTAARALHDRAVALYREIGDSRGLSYALNGLAFTVRAQGDYAAAGALYEESLTLAREMDNKQQIARALGSLGYLATRAGDGAVAVALLWEALGLWRELGSRADLARCLQNLADLALLYGRSEDAVCLLGAAEALCEEAGIPASSVIAAEYDGTLAAARAALSPKTFAAAWAAGRAMPLDRTLEQAIAVLARGEADSAEEIKGQTVRGHGRPAHAP